MFRYVTALAGLFGLLLGAAFFVPTFSGSVLAAPRGRTGVVLRRATDPRRMCKNRAVQERKRKAREERNQRLRAQGTEQMQRHLEQ